MSDALARYGSCTLAQDGCSTCGEAGVPVRLLAVAGAAGVVEDRTGARTEVALDLVEGARPGDILLVHAGVALLRLAPAAESTPARTGP